MDTSQQVAVIPQGRESSVAAQRQRRSIAEKRRIVEETLVAGASVARVARDATGTVFPAVADGYYLMLRPLPAGQHIIKFGGVFFGGAARCHVPGEYDRNAIHRACCLGSLTDVVGC
jgi:hypothetical protein